MRVFVEVAAVAVVVVLGCAYEPAVGSVAVRGEGLWWVVSLVVLLASDVSVVAHAVCVPEPGVLV